MTLYRIKEWSAPRRATSRPLLVAILSSVVLREGPEKAQAHNGNRHHHTSLPQSGNGTRARQFLSLTARRVFFSPMKKKRRYRYIPGWIRLELMGQPCAIGGETRSFGRNKGLQIDHIIPVCKGGGNERSNFRVLCYLCNARRRHVPDDQVLNFRNYQERKDDAKRDAKLAATNAQQNHS